MGRNARGSGDGEGRESGSTVAETGSPEEVVSQLLEGLGAGSRVMVERTWPGHAAGYLRYFEADEGTQACDLLEMIRASYGGGRFRIRPIGPRGKYARGSRTVQIAGDPRVESPGRASEPPVFVAPQRDPLVEVLLQRLLPPRESSAAGGGELVSSLVGHLVQKGDTSNDFTKQLVLALLQQGAAQPRERSSFSELREVVALMRELQGDVGGGGGGGGDVELLEVLKLLKQAPPQGAGHGMQGRPQWPPGAPQWPPGSAPPQWPPPGAPPPQGGLQWVQGAPAGPAGPSGPPAGPPAGPAPTAAAPPAAPSSGSEFEPLTVDDYLGDLAERTEQEQIELLRRVLPRISPRVLQAVVAGEDEDPGVSLTGGEWNVTAIGGRKGQGG